MELYQLAYFAEAVRQRSFTKAAAVLGIAQPALRASRCGTSKRSWARPCSCGAASETTPTPAGAALPPQAQALLDMADMAKQTVAEVARTRQQTGRAL